MDGLPKKDSAFVLTAVEDIYRNDLHRLVGKTYSGYRKEGITPEKKKVLNALFAKRLKNYPDSEQRMKKISKCVKYAIESINKSESK